MILSDANFRQQIPEADKVWLAGGVPFKTSVAGEIFFPQRVFVRGDVKEVELATRELFGTIKPLSSISLTLYESATRHIRYGKFYQNPQANNLLMGGREFAVPGRFPSMYHIDRNSAYPAIARNFALPVPFHIRVSTKPLAKELKRILDWGEGFGKFKFCLREDIPHQGVLPIRSGGYEYPRHRGDVVAGVWTLNEVRYALSFDYEIIDCEFVYFSYINEMYMRQYMSDCIRQRQAAETVVEQAIYKALANKLLGRLGMRSDAKPIRLLRKNPVGGSFAYAGELWDISSVPAPNWRLNRLHSAIVVAEQRNALHNAILKSVNPVYAFTDSLVAAGLPPVEIGGEVGSWKLFHEDPKPYRVRGLGYYKSEHRCAHRGDKEWKN